MLIPQYWAEAVCRHRSRQRQLTVRRYGWSMHSQDEARAMAESRASAALQQKLDGTAQLPSRESAIGYNGSDGVPIREEVLSRHEQAVITRNGYGARCLNTPDVLFVDVDFDRSAPLWLKLLLGAVLVAIAQLLRSHYGLGLWPLFVALALVPLLNPVLAGWLPGLQRISEPRVLQRLQHLLREQPALNFRIYRTPAGLRLLETSATHDPASEQVAGIFRQLLGDERYAAMCLRQQCFRARLSAKPWRIGIRRHMRPRTGNWPVSGETLQARQDWIAQYEKAAAGYAACSYLRSVGSGQVAAPVRPVMRLHDEQCAAMSQRPLA